MKRAEARRILEDAAQGKFCLYQVTDISGEVWYIYARDMAEARNQAIISNHNLTTRKIAMIESGVQPPDAIMNWIKKLAK